MAEKYGDILAQRVATRISKFVATEAALSDIPVGMSDDGMLAVTMSERTLWLYDKDSTDVAGTYVKVPTDARSPGRWHRVDATLASAVAGLVSDVSGMTCLSGDAVNDFVYVSAASTVAKADADDAAKIPAVGMIVSKQSSTSCTVRVSGLATGLSGLTAGAVYYLSAATAGAITATPPSAPAAVPVGVAVSTTALLILPVSVLSYVLRSVTANLGADAIGYPDASSKTTAARVGAAIDELYVDRLTTAWSAPIPLSNWRIVSAGGDVGNIAAIGGGLGSDTDPILRADANGSWEIFWAAASVVPVGVQVPLPPDFDDTGDAILALDVYSGATDAATMGVASTWNGGAEVTDSADDAGTKSATRHRITATIAHGDIPAGATHVTFRLTPPAHAADGIALVSSQLRYTPKLLP